MHATRLYAAVAALFISSTLLTGCIAHEKSGDSAAAVGDWKAAVLWYRNGLAEDPESVALKEKYANAKREAASGSYKKAQSCAAANDYACAIAEADYALTIDDGNTEIASFRANAARAYASDLLKQSWDASTRGEHALAFQQLEKARSLSNDPLLQEDVGKTRVQVLTAAQNDAERLRQQRQLQAAVDLWTLIVRTDASKAPQLDAARRELADQLLWEYEQHAQKGDAALTARRWVEAEQHYRAALAVKPGGRAEGLANYAQLVGQGDAAVNARDYAAATNGYKAAVATGLDATGYANNQLRLVELKPYAIRIRSVMVKPVRPNGQPWVGAPNALFWTANKLLAAYIPKVVGEVVNAAAIDAAETVPVANRPAVTIEAVLPDGSRLRTPEKRAVYAAYDAEFVIRANVFDDRRLVFKVFGGANGAEEIGIVETSVKDLISRQQVTLAAQSVIALELGTGSADGRQEFTFAGMTQVGGSTVAAPGGTTHPASGQPHTGGTRPAGGRPRINIPPKTGGQPQ